jgi:hypothetical protein
MTYVEREIVLHSSKPFGASVPLLLSSQLFRSLEATTKPCVRMAFEGSSTSVGATPHWLEKAIDIRTLGFSERDGSTILHLQAPELGVAAPKLFEQPSLFPGVASSQDTALDLVGKILGEVGREDQSSDLYDRSLLAKLGKWNAVLSTHVSSLDFPSGNGVGPHHVTLNVNVLSSARTLSDRTPNPRQTRIVGRLDMVRHSTRSFELILDNNVRVRGVLVDGPIDNLRDHLGNDITVLGKAVYRPSGTLLRIDASEILSTSAGRTVFSVIPQPFDVPNRVERKLQAARVGVSAFFGNWPGDETDEDLLGALAEIRH